MGQTAAEIDLGIPADTITLNKLASDVGVNISSAWRWITAGIKGPDGERHVLPSEKIGGRQYVSAADFRAWRAKISGQAPQEKPQKTGREKHRKVGRRLASAKAK